MVPAAPAWVQFCCCLIWEDGLSHQSCPGKHCFQYSLSDSLFHFLKWLENKGIIWHNWLHPISNEIWLHLQGLKQIKIHFTKLFNPCWNSISVLLLMLIVDFSKTKLVQLLYTSKMALSGVANLTPHYTPPPPGAAHCSGLLCASPHCVSLIHKCNKCTDNITL